MDYHYYYNPREGDTEDGVTVQAPLHGHPPPPATVNQEANERKAQRDKAFINNVLYVVIAILLTLILRDLYHVYALRAQNRVNENYVKAVRSSKPAWKAGWKMEQIQEQLVSQRRVLSQAFSILTGSLYNSLLHFRSTETPKDKFIHDCMLSTALYELLVQNQSAYVTMTCQRNARVIRIGARDFTDTVPDNCQVATGASQAVDPSSIFELVPMNDGKIGIRGFASGRFIKVIPPGNEKYDGMWRLEVSSPVPGLAEKFTYSEGTMYNELLQGFIYCSDQGPIASPVEGAVGTLYGETVADVRLKSDHIFLFNLVTEEQLEAARLFKAMSEQIQKKQKTAIEEYQKSTQIKLDYEQYTAQEKLDKEGATIAIVVPVTSKDTLMRQVVDSPFFINTFQSFIRTINWQTNRFNFVFYLGFDYADPLYDTGDAWSEMRAYFAGMIKEMVAPVFHDKASKLVSLRLQHFRKDDVGEGAPSQVVSRLAQLAYKEGADYFYQVNDDTEFHSQGWAEIFTHTLAHSPLLVNLGVTGPYDTNNPRILTHSFVHRTHIDIFGSFFPPAFKNWWSDDWISAVYGRMATFRAHQVTVAHNTKSRKQAGVVQRYGVDKKAQDFLRPEVLHGFTKINAYLRAHGRPPLPLPDVCGYSPLVKVFYDYVAGNQHKDADEKVLHIAGKKKIPKDPMTSYDTSTTTKGSKTIGGAPSYESIINRKSSVGYSSGKKVSLSPRSGSMSGGSSSSGSTTPKYTDRPKLAEYLKARHAHDSSSSSGGSSALTDITNSETTFIHDDDVSGYKGRSRERPSFSQAKTAVQ